MKSLIALVVFFVLSLTPFSNQADVNKPVKKSKIQLALLLDTSNSMDGLIDQAKSQLWKIVNELALSKKTGNSVDLYVALYEYGNDAIPANEGHLRNVVPFTRDLDKISEELFKLKTLGGEEFCGRVIMNAVNNLQWDKSNDILKIIFIAGNEPFTQGNTDYQEACKKAISKGIIVNTIHCGGYEEGVQTMWKHAADLTDGKYINIDHNMEIAHIVAPQDDEIIRLGRELNNTYLAFGYGGQQYKGRQAEQDENTYGMSPEAMVHRSVTKSGVQYNNSAWDLVDASKEGTVKVEDLKDDELPEEMKKMSVKERKTYIEKVGKQREAIQERINELNAERSKYVAKKMLENKNENTLDAVMIKTIREQAEHRNYKFN